MNKFYKTSYPKTSSINQILKNKKQIKKQTFRKQDLLTTHINGYKQVLSNDIKLKQRFHLDNKIQIDPQLLFSKNENFKKMKQTDRIPEDKTTNHSLSKPDRKTVFQQMQKRKQQNKTQSRFYQPQQTPKVRMRPQSKQETRNRIFSGHSTVKNQFTRPQTSKGSRRIATKQRLLSVQDQNDIDIIISRNNKRISHHQQRSVLNQRGKKKYNFQTSIDDQFLSLFAN